jgi:ankyrin repeat protein
MFVYCDMSIHEHTDICWTEKSPSWWRKSLCCKEVDSNQKTALHVAITKNKSLSVIRFMLSQLGDVDARDVFGSSYLDYAAEYSTTEVCKLLLDNNANVNSCTILGITPLYSAIIVGNLYVCAMLIDYGADINYRAEQCHSPLTMAFTSKYWNVTQFLLEQGAGPLSESLYTHPANNNAYNKALMIAYGADVADVQPIKMEELNIYLAISRRATWKRRMYAVDWWFSRNRIRSQMPFPLLVKRK